LQLLIILTNSRKNFVVGKKGGGSYHGIGRKGDVEEEKGGRPAGSSTRSWGRGRERNREGESGRLLLVTERPIPEKKSKGSQKFRWTFFAQGGKGGTLVKGGGGGFLCGGEGAGILQKEYSTTTLLKGIFYVNHGGQELREEKGGGGKG